VPAQVHFVRCTSTCWKGWLLNETLCLHYQFIITQSWSVSSAAVCQLSLSAQLYYVNLAAICQLSWIAMCQLSCNL